jgi:arsenate reductase
MEKKMPPDKVYYLSTCDTCRDLLKDTGIGERISDWQDIKTAPISGENLDYLKKLAGSYEALFSRRARKYKERGLKDRPLTEADFRELILEDYTFLKRPVILFHGKIYIGSEAATRKQLAEAAGQKLAR